MDLRDASVVARMYGGRDAPIQTGSRSRVACARFDLRRDVVEEAALRGAKRAERIKGRRAEVGARCVMGFSSPFSDYLALNCLASHCLASHTVLIQSPL